MRMFAMLRAMDAFVGEQDDNTGDGGAAQDVVTCHRCGAPVEDEARATQADGAGQPKIGVWLCDTHMRLFADRLLAAIYAPDEADGGTDGGTDEDGE